MGDLFLPGEIPEGLDFLLARGLKILLAHDICGDTVQ